MKDAANNTQIQAEIPWRIERLPSSPYLLGVCTVLLLAYLFEAIDNGAIGYYLPYFAEEFHLQNASLGYVSSVGHLGVMIGAITSGILSDKFGRRNVIAGSMIWWGISGLLLAWSPNFTVLIISRVLIGIGVGAEVPAVLALLSELLPSKLRGRYFSICLAMLPLGACFAGLISYFFIPYIGWRGVAIVEAVPAFVSILVIKAVPESPIWLASKGYFKKADVIMTKIEQSTEKSTKKALPPVYIPENITIKVHTKSRVRDLFSRKNLKTTIMVTIWWPAACAVVYGMMTWINALLIAKGFTMSKSIGYVSLMYLAGILGTPFVSYSVDRFGRKKTAITLGILSTIFVYFYGTVSVLPLIILFGALYNICYNATGMVNNLYTPELFPTHMRATGTGYSSSVGRIGSIASPIIMGYLMQGFGPDSVFYFAAGLCLTWVLAIAILGPETKGKIFTE